MGAGPLVQSGTLWAMSSRVHALFIRHTRTGNPLVDSVAEHRSTPLGAYMHYFHITLYFGLFGFLACMDKPRTEGKIFITLYVFTTTYFSSKMIRLIVLLAPAMAVVAGYGIKTAFMWSQGKVRATYYEMLAEADAQEKERTQGAAAADAQKLAKDAKDAKEKKDAKDAEKKRAAEKTTGATAR